MYFVALYIAFIAGELGVDLNNDMTNLKHEIKLLVDTYVVSKHLYVKTETFIETYNFIRHTHFTVEQLEKYLLLT
jgi:archaellin